MVDSDRVAPPQEPPTTTGKLTGDMAGSVETTKGLRNELEAEINEGLASIPEDWEVEQGVPEPEDAGNCIECEAKVVMRES